MCANKEKFHKILSLFGLFGWISIFLWWTSSFFFVRCRSRRNFLLLVAGWKKYFLFLAGLPGWLVVHSFDAQCSQARWRVVWNVFVCVWVRLTTAASVCFLLYTAVWLCVFRSFVVYGYGYAQVRKRRLQQ